jgi:hypothetical protein
MKKRQVVLTLVFVFLGISTIISSAFAKKPEGCVPAGPFLILENQSYALCATANCFTYNQVVYCGYDTVKGDSISLPLQFDSENVSNLPLERGR